MKLIKDIELYATSVLDEYEARKVERKKIIYDAVFGTHELTNLEVNIIDLPFIQRLRNIHQIGLAYLLFPSATHSRFEHSLGVSILAGRMGRALKDVVSEDTIAEVRIAGLLHDIGHGPFSHLSDEIFLQMKEVKEVFKMDNRFSQMKPHEMISFYMLQSKSFRNLFENVLLNMYNDVDVNLDNISQMIIGAMDDAPNNQYKSDIINGPFDADKFDYLTRDAYFTGIKLSIGIDRIIATQSIDTREGKNKRIIGSIGGVHVLEQVLFGKMLLYPSVYHHHKVRACDCMIKSIFEIIRDNDMIINGLKFDKVIDFLSIDDNYLLTEKGKPEKVKRQIKKIKQRNLLKRALVISRKTLMNEENFENLLELIETPDILRDIAKEIAEHPRLKGKCEYYDIWIDVPRSPRFPEPSQYLIKLTDKDYLPLSDFFPISEWTTSYEINKWKGYVFGPANLQKTVEQVSRAVIERVLGIEFNEQATILAKHSSFAS